LKLSIVNLFQSLEHLLGVLVMHIFILQCHHWSDTRRDHRWPRWISMGNGGKVSCELGWFSHNLLKLASVVTSGVAEIGFRSLSVTFCLLVLYPHSQIYLLKIIHFRTIKIEDWNTFHFIHFLYFRLSDSSVLSRWVFTHYIPKLWLVVIQIQHAPRCGFHLWSVLLFFKTNKLDISRVARLSSLPSKEKTEVGDSTNLMQRYFMQRVVCNTFIAKSNWLYVNSRVLFTNRFSYRSNFSITFGFWTLSKNCRVSRFGLFSYI